MNSIMITFAIVVAMALIHFSFVDFRFRYRNGMHWFWTLNPAPTLMWVGRATIVVALLLALSTAFVGLTTPFALVLGGVMAAHILSLILLEVLEPR